MAKVDSTNPFLYRPDGQSRPAAKKSDRGNKTRRPPLNPFSLLEQVDAPGHVQRNGGLRTDDATIEELFDAAQQVGAELRRHADFAVLKRYKEAVRRLMAYVVSEGFGIQEHISGRNVLVQKKYTLVTRLDEKLEQLARGFLEANRQQIDLLARLDEIDGLLVDLLQ